VDEQVGRSGSHGQISCYSRNNNSNYAAQQRELKFGGTVHKFNPGYQRRRGKSEEVKREVLGDRLEKLVALAKFTVKTCNIVRLN